MFHSTRLKLTAWYLSIIMLVSVSFSVVIYHTLAHEIERFERVARLRIERRLRNRLPSSIPMANPELLEETKRRVFLTLLAVNSGIFVCAGGLGYLLAGRTLRPIADMVDEQNRFITDASHQLRTPLASLKSAMEVHLRDTHLTLTDAKKLIADNIADVNKLQTLSDTLIALAGYHHPANTPMLERVEVSSVVNDSIDKIRPLARKRNISIEQDIQNCASLGNRDGIRDLLVILLDNAIKYSPKKSMVTVNAKKTEGSVIVSVRDLGIGIAEKDISHVFDRFYRGTNAQSRLNIPGHGLGLSIAKKIVEAHHGSIHVESIFNTGTTVIVRLPLFS